jgi:hypothetical protein
MKRMHWMRCFFCLILSLALLHPLGFGDSSVQQVENRLKKLDGYVQSEPQFIPLQLDTTDIKIRDIYRNYLAKASAITQALLRFKSDADTHEREFTLQRLSAFSQELVAENNAFKNSFEHGEEQFESYQLIAKAILSVEDAAQYWKISSRYRVLYRGTTSDKASDDESLKIKLEAAFQAIERLQAIEEVRKALDEHVKN